jgi:hypothetical protein
MQKRFLLGPKLSLIKEEEENEITFLTWNPFTFSYNSSLAAKIPDVLIINQDQEGNTIFNPNGQHDINLGVVEIRGLYCCGLNSYVLDFEDKSPILLILTPEGRIKEKLEIPLQGDIWPLTSAFYYDSFLVIPKMWFQIFLFKKEAGKLVLQQLSEDYKNVSGNAYVINQPYFLLDFRRELKLSRFDEKGIKSLTTIRSEELFRHLTSSGFLDISTLRIFICTNNTSDEPHDKFVFEVWQPCVFPVEEEKLEFKLVQRLEREMNTKFFSFDSNFLYFLSFSELEVLVWQDGKYLEVSHFQNGKKLWEVEVDNHELKFEDFREIAKGLEVLCPLPLVLLVESIKFLC